MTRNEIISKIVVREDFLEGDINTKKLLEEFEYDKNIKIPEDFRFYIEKLGSFGFGGFEFFGFSDGAWNPLEAELGALVAFNENFPKGFLPIVSFDNDDYMLIATKDNELNKKEGQVFFFFHDNETKEDSVSLASETFSEYLETILESLE